jgi:hypothetical protein
MTGPIAVGAYQPNQPKTSDKVDRSQTTAEVLDSMKMASSPVFMARQGGYVKAADGCVRKGKTRGKMV